jgi:mannose-1-phosphate guanylyltransferase/mannose-1-phosphate guanylyltransferase/mannose-6-phosphate isomerase
MEPLKPYKEERPWGYFLRFTANEASTVKIISIKPNESLSLQTHEKRAEFWKIISGDGEITIGKEKFEAQKGDEFFIEPKIEHRAKANDEGLEFLEIATGEYNEEDIKRIEDKYNRI